MVLMNSTSGECAVHNQDEVKIEKREFTFWPFRCCRRVRILRSLPRMFLQAEWVMCRETRAEAGQREEGNFTENQNGANHSFNWSWKGRLSPLLFCLYSLFASCQQIIKMIKQWNYMSHTFIPQYKLLNNMLALSMSQHVHDCVKTTSYELN